MNKRQWATVFMVCAIIAVSCSAEGSSELAETATSQTSSATTVTTTTAAPQTTTTAASTTDLADEDLDVRQLLSNAIDELDSAWFTYSVGWRNPTHAALRESIGGFQDPSLGFVFEAWRTTDGTNGMMVLDGVQYFGRPDVPLNYPAPEAFHPWDWIAIPEGYGVLVPTGHPDPVAASEFRYASTLRRTLDEALLLLMVDDSINMATPGGIITVSNYAVVVPAQALAATVGNASEARSVAERAVGLDADVYVTVSIDDEGRLRYFGYDVDVFSEIYSEVFGVESEPGGYRFGLTIEEYNPLLAPAWLPESPSQVPVLDVESYLGGGERIGEGVCVWHQGELGWPALGDQEVCEDEYVTRAVATITLSLDGTYPGYDVLDAHAAELCRSVLVEKLGAAALEEDYFDVLHRYPGLAAWDLGDRTVVCGISRGRY